MNLPAVETHLPTRRRYLSVVLIALLGFFLVGLLIVWQAVKQLNAPTVALWSQIQVGDTEDSVRRKLGQPMREYTRANAPTNYYLEGYGHKERPVSGKVLIYIGGDLALYLWLDVDGRVEEQFTARS